MKTWIVLLLLIGLSYGGFSLELDAQSQSNSLFIYTFKLTKNNSVNGLIKVYSHPYYYTSYLNQTVFNLSDSNTVYFTLSIPKQEGNISFIIFAEDNREKHMLIISNNSKNKPNLKFSYYFDPYNLIITISNYGFPISINISSNTNINDSFNLYIITTKIIGDQEKPG